jgi:hypothetical protein
MVGGVINTAKNIMSLFSPVQVSSYLSDKQEAQRSKTEQSGSPSLVFPSPRTTTNIFRCCDYNSPEFATAPESIEFDYSVVATMSHDSSLTDNDTILLLADKRPMHTPREEVSIECHNRVVKNAIEKLDRRITCPQFLPSLKFSTEQDRAIVDVAIPSSSKNGVFQTSRSGKGGIVCLREFVSRSFGFGDILSPRHVEFGGGNSFSGSYNKEEMVNNDLIVSGPTYEFSLHSCSKSPTPSDDDQFWRANTIGAGGGRIGDGSLVTHKPRRLRRKIMNTLRSKKSRKSIN